MLPVPVNAMFRSASRILPAAVNYNALTRTCGIKPSHHDETNWDMERMLAPRARTASNFSQTVDFPIISDIDLERMLPRPASQNLKELRGFDNVDGAELTQGSIGNHRIEIGQMFHTEF